MHSRVLQHHTRPRFIGFHIPLEISRPIRAGLLLGVERGSLFDLIITIMQSHSVSFPIQDIFYIILDDPICSFLWKLPNKIHFASYNTITVCMENVLPSLKR